MEHVERNFSLIKESMVKQLHSSIELGKKLIDSELDAGIFNFIVRPIVKTFYSYWSNHDVKAGTLQQIDITLNSGKALLENGSSQEKFDKIIEESFPIYLAGDQSSRNCKKRHKNYQKLVEITKATYITQVRESAQYLNVKKEGITSYDDLSREVFQTREQAHKALMIQLDFNEDGIKVIEQDPTILTVPTGRNIILRVLRKGFDITKEELINNLQGIYQN